MTKKIQKDFISHIDALIKLLKKDEMNCYLDELEIDGFKNKLLSIREDFTI